MPSRNDDPRSDESTTHRSSSSSSKNGTSSSMGSLSQHELQKPAALLNLSTYSQESEVNESMERQQYRSPQRCLRSTPTPAVSPLVSTYPLSRGHHHQKNMMNGGTGSFSEKRIMIRPFPSLEGSPLSLSSGSTQISSWSEDLRSLRIVKKVLNLEEHQEPESTAGTTPMKLSKPVLGSDSELKVSKEASSTVVSMLSMTPSPKKKASSKHDTPDTGTTEPSDASSPANRSTSTGLNTPVPIPFKKTLFYATVHQTEESDEVEIILGARSPVKSNLLDLHDRQQQRSTSPETPLILHEHPSSPSRLLDLCGFSVHDWCNSNHCALAATCETACGSHQSVSPGDDSTQQHMQSSICVSLGSMDGLCQPWQASYPPRSITQNKLMHHRQHASKRRNLDLHKRRAHLNSIRRDLNPFNLNTGTTSDRQRRPLSKSQSFNHYSSPSSKSSKPMDSTAATTTSTGLPLVWACGGLPSANHKSPAAIRLQWEDECQDYDSDPEDYSPRRSNKENSNSTTLQSNNASTLEEFLNSRTTLILHEAGKSVAVHVWVELGQRLHNQTILPKLVWRRCRDSFKTPTERMDLLDICRIFPPSTGLDRTCYPFARTDRLLQIHSVRGPVVVFEARSTSERDRWMTLSKLAVSVFAAQLLTNDPTALALFFVDNEAAVGPGEEPLLWQQQPSKPQQSSSNASHKEAWV